MKNRYKYVIHDLNKDSSFFGNSKKEILDHVCRIETDVFDNYFTVTLQIHGFEYHRVIRFDGEFTLTEAIDYGERMIFSTLSEYGFQIFVAID